jgi:hypothetical protein
MTVQSEVGCELGRARGCGRMKYLRMADGSESRGGLAGGDVARDCGLMTGRATRTDREIGVEGCAAMR